jgi:hypothetical protein
VYRYLIYLDKELRNPKVVEEDEKKDPKKKGQPDPKKDIKKKPGNKKEEEEEANKVEVIKPKVKLTLDMIEEQSLAEFLKVVRAIQMRTPKLLLIAVTLENASELGRDPEELSAHFLMEKLNQHLETKVIFERNFAIADWAEKMENEVYPEEAVILFENFALNPVELGYEQVLDPSQASGDRKGKNLLVRCLYDQIQHYAANVSQYGNVSNEANEDACVRRLPELRKARPALQCVHQT